MRNLTALMGLLLVACWPFSGRPPGRHRAYEPTVPMLEGFRLRLDVVAGRMRRRSRAEQQNSAPFPPRPVERAVYFPPDGEAQGEDAWETAPLVPRWLDVLAPDMLDEKRRAPGRAKSWEQ